MRFIGAEEKLRNHGFAVKVRPPVDFLTDHGVAEIDLSLARSGSKIQPGQERRL